MYSIDSVNAMRCSLNEARNRFSLVDGQRRAPTELGERWQPPPPGWVKLNTDGAFSPLSPGIASGGILWDEHGKFLIAFIFKGNDGDSFTAELWGCMHGLKLAWDIGLKNIILEVDAAEVVTLLRSSANETHEDRSLINHIKEVVDREWNVEIRLISRWRNNVADHLAKTSLSAMPGFHVISHPDMDLERVLELEKG